MVDYRLNRIPWDEAVRTLKRDTRRYAKRQLTWFRADGDVIWIDPHRIEELNDFENLFGVLELEIGLLGQILDGVDYTKDEIDEIRRLKTENAKLKEERDFLKKAVAYFAEPKK